MFNKQCDVEFLIDENRVQVMPGDTIEGTVIVKPRVNIEVKQAVVNFVVCTEGKGSADNEELAVSVVSGPTVWRKTEMYRYRFSLTIPQNTPYYLGHTIKTGWELQFDWQTGNLSDRIAKWREKNSLPLQTNPEPTTSRSIEVETIPEGCSLKTQMIIITLGLLFFGAVPIAGLAISAIFNLVAAYQEGGMIRIIPQLAFYTVGVLTLAGLFWLYFKREKQAKDRITTTTIQTPTHWIDLDRLPITIRTTAEGESFKVKGVEMNLSVYEEATETSGSTDSTYKKILYKHRQIASLSEVVSPGLPFEHTLVFDHLNAEQDLPNSFQLENNKVKWDLNVWLIPERGRTLISKYQLHVGPA